MPPKRNQSKVDDEYQEDGRRAYKKRDTKDVAFSEVVYGNSRQDHRVIDLEAELSGEDSSIEEPPQKIQHSLSKGPPKAAARPTNKGKLNAAKPVSKIATPRGPRKKAVEGKIVVKELPPPIIPSKFPRFDDGLVYVIIDQSNPNFQYLLHADTLSRASPKLASCLLERLDELDDGVKRNGTRKSAEAPATKGTKATARFDLEYLPKLKKWVLNRTIFTTRLPPRKATEIVPDSVISNHINVSALPLSSGQERSTDTPNCSMIQPKPNRPAQKLVMDERIKTTFDNHHLDAVLNHRTNNLEVPVKSCSQNKGIPLKNSLAKDDSTAISPTSSKSNTTSEPKSKAHQGLQASCPLGQQSFLEASSAQGTSIDNETQKSPGTDQNAAFSVPITDKFMVENKGEAAHDVNEAQSASTTDIQMLFPTLCKELNTMPCVSQDIEQSITAEVNIIAEGKITAEERITAEESITAEQKTAVEPKTYSAVSESEVEQLQAPDSTVSSKLSPPIAEARDYLSSVKPETKSGSWNDAFANFDGLESQKVTTQIYGLTNEATPFSGLEITGTVDSSKIWPENSPLIRSLETDGAVHLPKSEVNDEVVAPKPGCSMLAVTDQVREGESPSISLDKPQEKVKLRGGGNVFFHPEVKSLANRTQVGTSGIDVAASANSALLKSPPEDLCRSYDRLLRIIYNFPPVFNRENIEIALEQYENLTTLATEFQCVKLVRSQIAKSSTDFGLKILAKAIRDEPPRWLKLSIALQDSLIFREAFVHIVGMQPEWPWAEYSLEEFDINTQNLIHSKAQDLSRMKFVLNYQLSHGAICLGNVRVSLFSVTPENFRTWVVVQVWRDWYLLKTGALVSSEHLLGQVYRTMAAAGDAYLPPEYVSHILTNYMGIEVKDWADFNEDLSLMKKFAKEQVQEICENRSMLDVNKESIKYLTCTEISDRELPWTNGRNP